MRHSFLSEEVFALLNRLPLQPLKPFTGLVGITVPTDSGKKDITREDNKEKR